MKVSPVFIASFVGLTFFQHHSLSAATFNIADGDVAGLKAAITTANGNSQNNTINLAANGTYTLSTVDNSGPNGTNGLPVLAGSNLITINGNGATIARTNAESAPLFRFMEVTGTVTINNLKFENGFGVGGAILSAGTLNLQGCSFFGNRVDVGTPTAIGGGALCNDAGTMNVTSCSFQTNTADAFGYGGVTSGGGGAIFNGAISPKSGTGTLTIVNSSFDDNIATGGGLDSAVGGGAIFNAFSPDQSSQPNTVNVSGSGFYDNQSDKTGGAICNEGAVTVGTSAFYGNRAEIPTSANLPPGTGGAIANKGTMIVEDCTLDHNEAANDGGAGGAIDSAGAFLTVLACTFNDNSSPDGAAIRLSGGTMHMGDTLLAHPDQGTSISIEGSGVFNSSGYNLSDDNGGGHLTASTDRINTDPQLDPAGLQYNGGPTQTIKLLSGSPALDKGNSFGLTTDQRGLPRRNDFPSIPNASGGDGSDIGAVEMDFAQTGAALSVTTADDHDDGVCGTYDCSLREAINAANSDAAPNTITITATGTMALQASLGPLAVTEPTTIIGPGARSLTVDGGGAIEVFSFASGTTSAISGLTISNGKITSSFAQGGGIYNAATLTVSDCQLTGNSVQGVVAVFAGSGGSGNGGAIYNGGILTLKNCTLSGNSARGGNGAAKGQFTAAGAGGNGSGGAVYNDTNATLFLTNCTLTNNSGTGANGGNSTSTGGNGGNGRGGIYNQGAMMITACTISGNTGTEGFGGNGSPAGALGTGDGGLTNIGTGIIGDTICAANTGNNGGNDLDGAFSSNGYNLIGSGTHSTGFSNGTNHDQVGTDSSPINPHLQAVQNNGGATDTMALFSTSGAINNGGGSAPRRDQRGDFRTGTADIGAFEYTGSLVGLSGITRTGTNDATITSEVVIGHTYQLQRRPDLTSLSTWANVDTPFIATGNDFEPITDLHGITGTMGFYRLVATQ